MGRRGRRSVRAKMRRFISRLLSREAHRDRVKSESINTLGEMEIAYAVQKRFHHIDWGLIHQVHRGEVLSDSRGEGSLQKAPC